MARSFGALNSMYAAGTLDDVNDIIATLQRTDQAMTFKELGVISTSDEVWRPKTTKLYNFVKTVDLIQWESSQLEDMYIYHESYISEGSDFLSTSIEASVFKDPIYEGVKRQLVGFHNKVKTSGH